MKNKCIKAFPKNHKGNYKISVSFDAFSPDDQNVVDEYVEEIEYHMREGFKNYIDSSKGGAGINGDVKLKNIRWNE